MDTIIRSLKIIKRTTFTQIATGVYGNPSNKFKLIGVTGTNGKTTIATLLYKIARTLGFKAGLISTVNVLINDKEISVVRSMPTTPDTMTLFKILNQMQKEGCEYVFMEVSSHSIDQGRIAGLHFAGGIFTNLTLDHMDYHKTFDNYFFAKRKFFDMLPTTAFALSNADDEFGHRMLEKTQAKKYLYGFKNKADFSERFPTRLIGEFNAYNVLAIYGTAKLLGFDTEKVKEILKTIEPPRGRMEYFTTFTGVLVIVDYAHTPDALEKVLLATRGLKPDGKIICVFGCGGDPDPAKRRLMGKIGASLSNIAIFTSDNPDKEKPEDVIAQMKMDVLAPDMGKVISIADRHEAILEAVKIAKEGDIILCAGKGHEDYQIIHGKKVHFSDMEELQRAFS